MTRRTPFALIATAALAFGASACGNRETNDEPLSTPAASVGSVKAVAAVDDLKGQQTEVTLDKGFLSALTSLGIAAAPTGTAKISSDGVASFPITGGHVEYYTPGSVTPYVRGIVNHDQSGLSLTKDGLTVGLEDFAVDPGRSVLTGAVTVNDKIAVASAPLFFLDGRTLKPLETGPNGTAILEGTTVKLKKEAADLLNTTFKTNALTAGLVIGVAKITIDTQ